jgi:type 1 glutamine amidotransferase
MQHNVLNKSLCRLIICALSVIILICGCTTRRSDGLIKVVILSGKNNHEWQKTTPLLVRIYKESGLFTVETTDKPDTLRYNDLKKFDVVVSNWNTWPDNDIRISKEWEADFLKYINKGGGAIFIHAGASSFYGWDEYHKIGIGRWGKETSHGEPARGIISGFDQNNPITKGIRDFYIFDEIWEKTDLVKDATVIANISATDGKDNRKINEPSMLINTTGKGLSFYTSLGHDERALLNGGLQTIILRASQWAAHREITAEPPTDLKENDSPVNESYLWNQTDTSLSLINNSAIIWQYNFNNRYGKPYFHPVTVNHSTLTCVSPPDHPWHLGLWFSWKFINGVNYWEYLNDFKSEETGYKAAGITKTLKTDILKNTDYSADISMVLEYKPADGNTVMNEMRNIHISAPSETGEYFMDYEFIFEPIADQVILDRTPITGEPEGQSWGGYSGLSVRFSQNFDSPEIIVPSDSIDYRKNKWFYMGFNTLNGDKAGISIFPDPVNTTKTTSWYIFNDPKIPFFYYSPAVLYDGRIILKKGDRLILKYRVWMLSGEKTKGSLDSKYNQYLNSLLQKN